MKHKQKQTSLLAHPGMLTVVDYCLLIVCLFNK